MEYAVTRIACRPKNQPRNDRQPVGLDKEVGRRIHRMGYRILPEDVLDSLGTTDREGISQMLDLLYTRISKEAKYREQILS